MQHKSIKLSDNNIIPVIGFGTWQLSPQEARRSVAEALEIGYRHIDTARIYGNEKQIGEAVRSSGISRSEVFVTTKLWTSDLGYESGLRAFDESLSRLGLDYVDLYLIHWPGHDPKLRQEAWKALCEIQRQGGAKSIGVSNYQINHLEQMASYSDTPPSVNQVEFHPFIYGEQKDLLEYCAQSAIALEAYSPLARGRLNDPKLSEIGTAYGKTASQVMLRWALQNDTIPLPRSSQATHIKENFEIFDFELSREHLEEINNINQAGRTAWNPSGLP
ncbi:aldo/keto reductase [Candidatus Saccharibacteria bacterium]|nr:aldo/keto reductase [Candidatus Saccharibacteria bacterium]